MVCCNLLQSEARMRKHLFNKANWFISNKQVKILNETDYSMSFQVGKYHVVLKYKTHRLIALCECKAGALLTPCSHILAAMSYLISNKKW